jgi:hypothetical protein
MAADKDNLRKSAAAKLGVSESNGEISFDTKSLVAGMGGWLGVAETIIPSILFGTVFAVTSSAFSSVIAAGSVAVGFILFRLITKKSTSSAAIGLVAVGFAAWLALRDGGQAVDYFIPGLWLNASYGAVLLVSILVRWPIIGVLVELLRGNGTSWRKSRFHMVAYGLITGLWVAFFSLRLIVQVPLFSASQLELLATAKVLMGPPMYALLIVSTWLLLKATVFKRR